MIQYFAIRNKPESEGGEVIALWKKETSNLHLEIIGKEKWMSSAINNNLVFETTEEEFSVMDAICEIPHIQSDGVYHYLGELEFIYQPGYDNHPMGDPTTHKSKVHAVVVDLDDSTITTRFVDGTDVDDMIMAEPLDESSDSLP